MKKTIWFWLYFILAIILAIYFATRIIMTGLGRGNTAHIRHISILADADNVDLSGILAATAIAPGTKTYKTDLDAVNARILATPGVQNSAIRRLPNGNLTIRVALYRAVALWTKDDLYYPLSADGTIVNRPTDTRDTGAVLFRGALPNDLTEITKVAHTLGADLDYLEWIEDRRWDIYTTSGIRVMLPEENPTDAIAKLVMLNKNNQLLSRDIEVIDMRDDARILVK